MRAWTKFAFSKYVTIPWLVLLTFVGFTATLTAQSNPTVATNIAISNTPIQSNVTRLGINLGGQAYYDSGQMTKNLVYKNPGFEPMKWRSVLQCVVVAANTCLDANTYNPQPTGFWTNATYYVMSGPLAGSTGTIQASTNLGNQQLVTFDKNLGLSVDTYVMVTNGFAGNGQQGWWTSGSSTASFTSETTDLSSKTVGTQALSVSALGSSASAQLTSYFDGTANHSFLTMSGTYQLTFRAKGLGGTNQLQVMVNRLNGESAFLNQTVQLTSSWQDYTLTFSADETGTQIGTMELAFFLSNSGMLIDDVSLVPTNGDSTNVTAFRDQVVSTLEALNPGTLRLNATEEIGADLYDQMKPAFARYREGVYTNADEIDDLPIGMPEYLTLCKQIGADPFITIPITTSPQEISDFIDYLTGSGSTTYSALRVSEGQTAPWTSVFNTIHIELGNEVWNGVFAGETMDQYTYPLWANQVFAAARKASGFDASKFDLVLSGWAAVPSYNQTILQYSTEHDSIDMAPYLAYTVNSEDMSAMMQNLFAEPEFLDTAGGYVYENALDVAKTTTSASGTKKATQLEVYEENMSTTAGTITQAQMGEFEPSLGAGLAVADHMLQQMRLGIPIQNTYALPQYQYSITTGITAPLFGMVVDMGTQNLRRPSFLAEALANTAIQGNMITTTQSGNNPTWTQLLGFDSVALSGAHYIQSFAFQDGTSYSMVLFNLSQTTALPVLLTGTNAPNGDVQVSQLNSANVTDNNETSSVVTTKTSTASLTPSTPYSLPAHSMTVLTWTSSGATSTSTGTTGTTGSTSTAGSTGSTTTTGTTGSTTSTGKTVSTVTAPVLSLASGTYTTAQSLAMSSATAGATIYYTTDGSTPTTSSTKYSSAITVAVSTTIKAIAVESGSNNSAVTTGTYTIETSALNFASGFAPGKMTLNGTASISGTSLVLTNGGYDQEGSAWYTVPENVQSFVTDFTFQQKNAVANGLTFTIQNQGSAAIGLFGMGLGYEGISKSVAVKFDLYNSGGQGTNSVGLFTNGTVPTVPSATVPTASVNLHSGDVMDAHLVYNGTKLTLTLTDTVTKGTFTTSFTVNIPSIVGSNTAEIGFTGGTGSQTATQDILTWSFSNSSSTTETAAAAPAFSVAAGTYTSAQTVSLTDTTPGATIYYTTNGTVPTTSSTKYTTAISVGSSETLEALAVASGYTNSAVSTAKYVINLSPSSTSTGATSISYASGFSGAASAFALNGTAAVSGKNLALTDGGADQEASAWYKTAVDVQSFTTDFTFQLADADADGFTFTIQNAGTSAIGLFGYDLGYQAITKSVAVKFDLFNNDGEGDDSTGLFMDGATPTIPSTDLTSSGIDLHSGHVMRAHLVYIGTTLAMTLTDTSTNTSVTKSYTVNIPSVVGSTSAYVGFTAGTGSQSAAQNILTWTYTH